MIIGLDLFGVIEAEGDKQKYLDWRLKDSDEQIKRWIKAEQFFKNRETGEWIGPKPLAPQNSKYIIKLFESLKKGVLDEVFGVEFLDKYDHNFFGLHARTYYNGGKLISELYAPRSLEDFDDEDDEEFKTLYHGNKKSSCAKYFGLLQGLFIYLGYKVQSRTEKRTVKWEVTEDEIKFL